jgi:hypothetical protein
MPKDEFDLEDPYELNGVMVPADEESTGLMAACLVDEYMQLGYDHRQILGLFGNRNYSGMHLVLRTRGEAYVRVVIEEAFARWGVVISWEAGPGLEPAQESGPEREAARPEPAPHEEGTLTDPMGGAVPRLND